jgi:hypothetical protein
MSTKYDDAAFTQEASSGWHVPHFKRFTVTIPLLITYPYGQNDCIEVCAQSKKEAIKHAKKHFRDQLRRALKDIKAYERT